MKLTTKFILVFFLISLLPLVGVAFFSFKEADKITRDGMVKNLNLVADVAEGHILTFFKRQKIRTIDWSSDEHIQQEVESIVKTGDAERAKNLGIYIKTKKLPLDSTIYMVDILDLSGTIIVSTNEERIGHIEPNPEELEQEYSFGQAKSASFGQAFISQLISDEESGHEEPVFHVSAPIISLESGEVVGIIVNHVLGDELNKILSGERQVELGAQMGYLNQYETLELYLVNRDGLIITPSRFISGAVLKQKVETEPVFVCHQFGREFSGHYKNYLDRWVYGASACPQDQWWMLLVEIEEQEALAEVHKLRQDVYFTLGQIFLALVLVGFLFGQRLVGRIRANLKALQEIERGNFSARVKISGRDAITELGQGINKMAEEIEKYIKQIKSLDVLKSKFITIVSHQFRTPLSAIRWDLETILEKKAGRLTKGQEEVLKIAYEATKEIISRINDLTTAMDIEEKRIKLEKEKISLEELLRSVCEEFKFWYKRKKIKYQVEYPKEPLLLVEVDPIRIRDVFYKLIDNAVSYTKEGGSIKVKIYKIDEKIRFEISDTGIGIPKSEQQYIFERFHRASNAFTMKSDASGLGLYIAKHFILAHGGEIGFESKEGKGSTFWFELPI